MPRQILPVSHFVRVADENFKMEEVAALVSHTDLYTALQNTLMTCQKLTSAQTIDFILALLGNKGGVASMIKDAQEFGNNSIMT
jgi:hypothetical protein